MSLYRRPGVAAKDARTGVTVHRCSGRPLLHCGAPSGVKLHQDPAAQLADGRTPHVHADFAALFA